jgi:hypothetical protein
MIRTVVPGCPGWPGSGRISIVGIVASAFQYGTAPTLLPATRHLP